MYSELLSIDKPTHLHVEIQQDSQGQVNQRNKPIKISSNRFFFIISVFQDISTLIPDLTNSTSSDPQANDSDYGQHVFCVSTQV